MIDCVIVSLVSSGRKDNTIESDNLKAITKCLGEPLKDTSPYSGTNIKVGLVDNKIVLVIDPDIVIGNSPKGNAMTATTGGFAAIGKADGGTIKISLNAMPS